MQDYNPGLHIVATISCNNHLLKDAPSCKEHFDALIDTVGLNKVGEVYHKFDEGGFTAVICLTESHISIHTWPEHNLATFDVFLSNFNNDNSDKARAIYNKTVSYFDAEVITHNEIKR